MSPVFAENRRAAPRLKIIGRAGFYPAFSCLWGALARPRSCEPICWSVSNVWFEPLDPNLLSQHIDAALYPFCVVCIQKEIPLSVSTHSYLIGETVTLLNEDEWKIIEPFAKNRIERIQKYRKMHGCGLKEAFENEDFGQEAFDKYEQLTGVRLNHPDQIWAVRMTSYGSLCPECQRPFRSSKAKLCANCGYQLPDGQLAGPLTDQLTRSDGH